MITDQRYRNNYVFAGLPPRKSLPRRWFAAGLVFKAGTLAELAEQIKIPADGLAETVQRFNGFAKSGKDEDFGRGDSAYDRYYGDPRCRPNPNLAALDLAPFYAIKIVSGDLGTKGDRAEVGAGRPVDVHVPAGGHRDRAGRGGQAHRAVPAVVDPR
jgi:3-oxosteroid 1-dehydrogenase